MTGLMHSIWTVMVFIVFIGIVLWAYSGARKKDYDEASRMALDNEPEKDQPKSGRNL